MRQLSSEQRAGIAYSVAALLPSILWLVLLLVLEFLGVEDYEDTQWYLYCSYLVTQVAFFLVLLFCLAARRVTFRSLGVRGCKPIYFLIAILAQFGLMFSLSGVNALFIEFLKGIFPGYNPEDIVFPSMEGFGIVGVFITVAVLPAVMEEGLFRGLVFGGLKKFGLAFSVLVSGALFSLFHMNPMQTVYQFLCGCMFALIAYKSGSILPTMLAHFLNNAAVVLIYYFGLENLSDSAAVALFYLSAVSLVLSLVWLRKDTSSQPREPGKKWTFFLTAGVGILVCALMWIYALVSYL